MLAAAVLFILGTALAGFSQAQDVQIDATAYCFQCSQRRNHKDTYPDPAGDCHYFYKCQYVNDTYAFGIRRRCPISTYWHDEILACMPEGSTPCGDLCQNIAVQTQGCYPQPGNCATYYVCSNTASYAFCCPPQTSFNPATCQCDASDTCTDRCDIATPPPTTVAPPQNFGTFCIDSFNNQLQPTNDPAVFQMVTPNEIYSLSCAFGTIFNLESCRCEGEVTPQTQPTNRQCIVYLPFDTDTKDKSNSNFFTELVEPAAIDNTIFAQGSGSLSLSGGHLEIPGTKNLDFYRTIGVCLYFRCNSPSCAGGLLSNNRDAATTELSLIIAALGINSAVVWGETPFGPGLVTVNFDPATNAPSGFAQICGSYNGSQGSIYINNQLIQTFNVVPEFAFAHCPMTVGSDQKYGDYIGNIDEVLVCPHALTADDVAAHWAGQQALVDAGLVPL